MAPRKLIFVILCLIALHTQGQNFHARALLGLNAAQVDGDSYGGYNQPGLLTGISVFRELNDRYNLGFEMLLSQKGSHKKTSEDDPAIFKLRYTYLCIPVFLDVKKTVPSIPGLFLTLGVSNNLRMNARVNFGFGWETSEIKAWELSGIAAAGYRLNDHFMFQIRHENSLLSIGTPGLNSNFYKINRRGLYNRLVSFVVVYEP